MPETAPAQQRPTRSGNALGGNSERDVARPIPQPTASAANGKEDRYRTLFEMAPFAVYTCDARGVISSFNPRAAELWGRSPKPGDTDERWCGSCKLFRPDGAFMPHHLCPMADVVSGKLSEVRDQEVLIQRPDGSQVTVVVNIRPLRDRRGEVAGAMNCFYDITDRKQAEKELRRSRDELERIVTQRTATLRKLSANLMRLQDDERRRISRDLHDSVGQYLTHIGMFLTNLRRPNPTPREKRAMKDVMTALEKCSTEVRTISYLLHPPLLDELGLSSAMSWYVEGFGKRSGIQVNLDVPAKLERLPAGIEIVLFRILQESLTNIHRHSHSQSASIRLKIRGNEALLEIEDRGQGLPPELLENVRSGAGGGVGLASIRERLGEVGGRLEIESNQKGTVIRAIVPLAPA